MMALFLMAAAAAPILLAFWVAAWLVGDVFGGPEAATVRVRSSNRRL